MKENKAKDTFFSKNRSLNCRGKLLSLDTPKVMGILNVTPDSFHDGGLYNEVNDAVNHAKKMIELGASIIDIGAASSRPGSERIHAEEELNRLRPIVSRIREELPDSILSIDTYNSAVAKEMLADFGVDMINDISAGIMDPEMFSVIADFQVPYLIMHMKGSPENMQELAEYDNVVDEIIQYFSERVHELHKLGVTDVLIDPGFGFAKTQEHNYELLKQFNAFQMFEIPLVAGISRKSMLYNLLNIDSHSSLNATTAAHMILLEKGANIIRVHDVKEAMEAIAIFNASR